MKEYGITLQEASEAFAKVSKLAFDCMDIDMEISLIRQNPSLSKRQKRKLIKEYEQMKIIKGDSE